MTTDTSSREPRWFGTVRRKDGSLFHATALVSKVSRQLDFIKGNLQLKKGDIVVDLFVNDCLSYHHYLSLQPIARTV